MHAKVTYYETKFNEFKSNTKWTWQLINNTIKPNSCRKNKTDILRKDVQYMEKYFRLIQCKRYKS